MFVFVLIFVCECILQQQHLYVHVYFLCDQQWLIQALFSPWIDLCIDHHYYLCVITEYITQRDFYDIFIQVSMSWCLRRINIPQYAMWMLVWSLDGYSWGPKQDFSRNSQTKSHEWHGNMRRNEQIEHKKSMRHLPWVLYWVQQRSFISYNWFAHCSNCN